MRHIILPHRGVVAAAKTSVTTASVGLIGGVALQTVTRDLLLITPLFIALPAINAMAGDYATLATAHIGDPETSKGSNRKLLKALLVSVPLSAFGVAGLSLLLASLQDYRVTWSFASTYTAFVFGSLILIVGITVASSFLLNKSLARRRVNSDDLLIPVSNVIASVLILLCVSVAAWRIF